MIFDLNFLLGLLLGTVLGIIIMILAALKKSPMTILERKNTQQVTDKIHKIIPFIKVHQKELSESNEVVGKSKRNDWEDRIEAFKLRNGFYQ